MKSLGFLLLLVIFGQGERVHARVFDFSKENISAYFRGTGGMSEIGKETFQHSSGSQTSFEDEVAYNFSGEIGFAFAPVAPFVVRLGAEILQSKALETKGLQTGTSTELFTLTSDVFVFNPNITIEMILGQSNTFRGFIYAGLGWATISLENQYEMTAAGSALYSTNSYTEESGTEQFSAQAGAGVEMLFTDTTTFALDVGYRYLPIRRLKYKSDVDPIGLPNQVKGEEVINSGAGDFREFDMGGLFVGASFRFYINVL